MFEISFLENIFMTVIKAAFTLVRFTQKATGFRASKKCCNVVKRISGMVTFLKFLTDNLFQIERLTKYN